MRFAYLPLLAALLVLPSCNRGSQSKEAVRQGVIDYLSKRGTLDMNAMQIDITSVVFRQNEADAVVAFRPKKGDPNAGMEMRYTLEQKGSRWVVKGKAGVGGSPAHGAGMGMGSTPPPPGHGSSGMPSLPPNHPPMGEPGSKK